MDASKPLDLWNPEHQAWSDPKYDFNLIMDLLATDNVIVATSLGFSVG